MSTISKLDEGLIGVASTGDLEAVADHISRGANPNAVDSAGWTPLLIAADNGHVNTAVALYLAGADPSAKQKKTGADLMTYAMSYSGGGDLNTMVVGIAMGIDPSGYQGKNQAQRDILEMPRLRAAVKHGAADLVLKVLEDAPDMPEEDIKVAKTQARRLKNGEVEAVLSSFLARRSAASALDEIMSLKP